MEYMFINLWSVYIEWCILYMHQMWLNQDNFGVFGNHNEEFIIKLNVYESMLKFLFILKAPDQGVMFNDSVKVIDCTSDSAVQNWLVRGEVVNKIREVKKRRLESVPDSAGKQSHLDLHLDWDKTDAF